MMVLKLKILNNLLQKKIEMLENLFFQALCKYLNFSLNNMHVIEIIAPYTLRYFSLDESREVFLVPQSLWEVINAEKISLKSSC